MIHQTCSKSFSTSFLTITYQKINFPIFLYVWRTITKCISLKEILFLSWTTYLSPAETQSLFCRMWNFSASSALTQNKNPSQNLQVHDDIHFQKLLLKHIFEFNFFTLYKFIFFLCQLAFALADRKLRFFYKERYY